MYGIVDLNDYRVVAERIRSMGKSYVVTGVCHSVQRKGVSYDVKMTRVVLTVEVCCLFREVTGSIPVSGLLAKVTEYYITEANEY